MAKKLTAKNAVPCAGLLGGEGFRPKCPNCGNESQNVISILGVAKPGDMEILCRNCGKDYVVSFSYENTKKTVLKKLTYRQGNTYHHKGNFIVPVPDGYHTELHGSDDNEKWTYSVPNDYPLSENHIDAKPYSFGITEKPAGVFPWLTFDMLDAFGDYLQSERAFDPDSSVRKYINPHHCAFLYQGYRDPLWYKITGFLFTGTSSYQFHVYANFDTPIELNNDDDDAFDEIATEWMNNITYLGEEPGTTTKRKTSAKEGTSTRSKPHSEQKANNNYLFPTYDVNDARQRILKKNRQKGRKPGQCDLCLTIPNEELARNGTAVKQFWYTCDLYSEDYAAHVSELQKIAADISKLFVDDPIIPRRDLELYAGNIHDIFSYHALRSFVWTSRTWCKKNKKLLSDFTLEDSLALSLFIAERDGLNYNKIDDKSPQIGAGLLASMHEVDIVVQNPKGFLDIPRDIFHSAAPGDANIFRVVEDLWAYRNIMMDARVYLQRKGQEALSEAENVLREIVASWCAYAFACRSPYFYVRPAVAAGVMIEEIPAWTAPKVETTLVDGKFETIDNVLVACHQTSGTVNIPEGIIDNMTPWNTSFDGMGNGNQIEKVIYPRSYHGQINFGIGVKSVECKGTATKVWAIWVPEHIPCTEYISIEKSLPDIGIHLSYAEHISEIILPEGLETIDLNSLPNGTKRISFPESLKKVEQPFSIFFGEKLEKVEVPKTCPALNEIRKYLASINKEYTLSITVSRQERRMESLKNDLIRASNADRALQIIDDNRECLSDETIRSALANRASKLASRLSSIVARWSGISASAESIAEFISGVLNSEYDEQSWQRCWEMGGSLIDSYVVEPIRGKFANEADPIMTFRELPMRLAEYVVEQYREGCIKHEMYAKISKLQALALEPISIQSDGGPTRPVFAEALKSQITSLQIDEQFFERLMNYSTDPTVQRFLTTIVKTTSPQNAEDIIFRLTEDRMTQYDQAVSRFRYTSTCRQITEYLKRPILPSDGDLPDKDLYRDSISRDIEVFNIDSSFVEELRRNWENRTIRIFDNVACSISRDNVNAYANTIIDRKMKQYDRVAAAVDALNNSKAELAREKEALENELSHLGIFAGKRKREIRALLEAMPEREAEIIAQGNQAISDADSASL